MVLMLPLSLVRRCFAPSARLGSTDTHDEHTRILKRLEQRQITHQNHSNGKNETMKQNAWYKHQVVSVCLLSISTIVWVSIAIFCFLHRLATVFVCLSVLLVSSKILGRLGKFRSNSVPSTDLLSGSKSRFFAKCWRGLQSVGKSSWSTQCGGCRCLHVCSMLRLTWLADKKEIVFWKFCVLCRKKQ